MPPRASCRGCKFRSSSCYGVCWRAIIAGSIMLAGPPRQKCGESLANHDHPQVWSGRRTDIRNHGWRFIYSSVLKKRMFWRVEASCHIRAHIFGYRLFFVCTFRLPPPLVLPPPPPSSSITGAPIAKSCTIATSFTSFLE